MNTITIVYDEIEYEVEVKFTADDSIYIVNYLNGEYGDFRFAIATVVKKHIIGLSADSINPYVLCECKDLNNYIYAILDENSELNALYEQYAEEKDICYKFALAVKDMWKGVTRELAQITPTISMPQVLFGLQQFANTLASLKKVAEPLLKVAGQLANIIGTYSAQINYIFSNIKFPQISDERKEELRKSYGIWGQYGWTMPPFAEASIFNKAPVTIAEAHKYMVPYCSKDNMTELFKMIDELPNLCKKEKKDLREAEFNFDHKNYKSCAMLIFSLLDAKLIRMQRKEDINDRTKRRDSGVQAANHIKDRIEKEHDINKKFFMLLSYTNLFACIEEFFAKGNDFKDQPQLANRNFVDHGMLHKNVRRRDCIQLFLLYYNFVDFFDILGYK